MVASLTPLYPYVLEVQGNIKTGADLKGAKIGITQFGSTIDAATRVALKQLGLSANDVTLLQLTSISARTEALLNNAIQAGLSSPPDSLLLEAHGLHVLVDLAELKAPASSVLLGARGRGSMAITTRRRSSSIRSSRPQRRKRRTRRARSP